MGATKIVLKVQDQDQVRIDEVDIVTSVFENTMYNFVRMNDAAMAKVIYIVS